MQQLNSRDRFVKLKHEGLNQISHRMLDFYVRTEQHSSTRGAHWKHTVVPQNREPIVIVDGYPHPAVSNWDPRDLVSPHGEEGAEAVGNITGDGASWHIAEGKNASREGSPGTTTPTRSSMN